MEGSIQLLTRESLPLFERLTVLGDPVRCRVLLLLEEQELAVAELCSILQLPQSTVSRHLKALTSDGWTQVRRDGTSRRYSASAATHGQASDRLWQLLRDEISSTSSARQDRERLAHVLEQRRSQSQKFFSSVAGEWAELRQELFGEHFDLEGLLGLLDDAWTVGDLGCGTGETTQAVAPFVDRVIAVDESPAMLAAARQRLAELDNVELKSGRLERLPIGDRSLDAALAVMVLHHLSDPPRLLAEVARVLKPTGKFLVVDMRSHDREEYRQQMGHVWLGFDESSLAQWFLEAGFDRPRFVPLKPDPQAKGPSLFTATGRLSL